MQQSVTYGNQQDSTLAGKRRNTILSHLDNRQKRTIRYIGSGLCFVSELIHLWLLPGQYEVFSGYGIIFLLIAMAQGFIGVNLLFEPRRRLLTFGLWANVLVAALYIFTHTIGVLVGIAFLPLPVDAYGIIATIVEIIAVILLYLLRADMPRVKRIKTRNHTKGAKHDQG